MKKSLNFKGLSPVQGLCKEEGMVTIWVDSGVTTRLVRLDGYV
jgi:hypothetical protein